MADIEYIRNFSIIAHIDHGKSTLADRIIERCGGLTDREMSAQVLDSMDLERERGITIKSHSVTLKYQAKDGQTYQFNIIDTPGHVDFAYEVSRSLSACEGALLVIDAAQGVEAQTLAVSYTAIEQGLVVVPVLNKIDLPQADPERVIQEIENIIGIEAQQALRISAKTGEGIEHLLETLIAKIPSPIGNPEEPLKALIIDSWFDNYLGVVSLVRIKEGFLRPKDKILVMSTGKIYQVDKLGVYTPKPTYVDQLSVGEVGFIVAGIKDIYGAPVGDTLTDAYNPSPAPLPGFQKVKPKVFAGLYPVDSDEYEAFRDALKKLSLNDASLVYEPESSVALGFGFRCGFLGMLHMEIVQERLEREYHLNLITTAPTVIFEILTTKEELLYIDNPSKLPAPNYIDEIREPMVLANILTPQPYVGSVMKLCLEKRGRQVKMLYHGNQVSLLYKLPMNEVVLDFHDRLKSISHGYASVDYAFENFESADLTRLDILINGEKVDALSIIVHKDNAFRRGQELTKRLKDIIPKQMFDVAIQAAIGNQIIARSSIKALRKNVLAKCYGGDITRKRKLLEKQKIGKKRMKQVGKINIPQEAFLAILKVDQK